MNLTDRLKDSASRKVMNLLGKLYLLADSYAIYSNEDNILGISIDDDIKNMGRKELCDYFDGMANTHGFYELQSTAKIRLGVQLFRNYQK